MPFQPTPEQAAVIAHSIDRHARVFAGPGTGKSATAAALAARILEQQPAPHLKFITFTRAATLELAKKLADQPQLKPATFHSFSISTLLANPGAAVFPHPLRIPSGFEYGELIRPHLAALLGVTPTRVKDYVAEMAARWESLDPVERPDVSAEERARFIGAFTEQRRIFGYTLLDELPDLLRGALRDNDDLQGIDFQLLVVDEYQDLNACELDVLTRFSARGVSIVAIGDDDQSIYSFRKAHPAGIQRFLQEFQNAADYALTICHRLPHQIARWAQHVMAGEPRRNKPPLQCRPDASAGTVSLVNFGSEISEARGVADLICWLRDDCNVPLSEILVLSRTDNNGTFTRRIRDELQARNVPVFDASEVKQLLKDADNRRLLATLRIAENREDSLAWWTLLNSERGLGPRVINLLYESARLADITFAAALERNAQAGFQNVPAAQRRIAMDVYTRVVGLIAGLDVPVATADMKWGAWIIAQSEDGHLPPMTEGLKVLLTKIDTSYAEAESGLGRFLSQLQPLAEDLSRAQSDGVRFMTVVSSKGLTVRATILLGADNDLMPRPGEDISEERRLLYVAMTRSKEYLFLTWANRRQGPAGRAGRANAGRRAYSELLRGGPVESESWDDLRARIGIR